MSNLAKYQGGGLSKRDNGDKRSEKMLQAAEVAGQTTRVAAEAAKDLGVNAILASSHLASLTTTIASGALTVTGSAAIHGLSAANTSALIFSNVTQTGVEMAGTGLNAVLLASSMATEALNRKANELAAMLSNAKQNYNETKETRDAIHQARLDLLAAERDAHIALNNVKNEQQQQLLIQQAIDRQEQATRDNKSFMINSAEEVTLPDGTVLDRLDPPTIEALMPYYKKDRIGEPRLFKRHDEKDVTVTPFKLWDIVKNNTTKKFNENMIKVQNVEREIEKLSDELALFFNNTNIITFPNATQEYVLEAARIALNLKTLREKRIMLLNVYNGNLEVYNNSVIDFQIKFNGMTPEEAKKNLNTVLTLPDQSSGDPEIDEPLNQLIYNLESVGASFTPAALYPQPTESDVYPFGVYLDIFDQLYLQEEDAKLISQKLINSKIIPSETILNNINVIFEAKSKKISINTAKTYQDPNFEEGIAIIKAQIKVVEAFAAEHAEFLRDVSPPKTLFIKSKKPSQSEDAILSKFRAKLYNHPYQHKHNITDSYINRFLAVIELYDMVHRLIGDIVTDLN